MSKYIFESDQSDEVIKMYLTEPIEIFEQKLIETLSGTTNYSEILLTLQVLSDIVGSIREVKDEN